MATDEHPMGTVDVMNHLCQLEGCGLYGQIVTLNTSQAVSQEQVRTALQRLALTYESLQMKIVLSDPDKRSSCMYKKRDDPTDVWLETVPVKQRQDWQGVASQHNYDSFPEGDNPLWKVIFCPVDQPEMLEAPFQHQAVFIFLFNHCIADGKSVYDLVSYNFIPIVSDVLNGMEVSREVVPFGKSVEEHFMTEEQRRNPVKWYMRLAMNLVRWKNRTFGGSPLKATSFVCADETPEVLKEDSGVNVFHPMVFSKEMTSSILQCAKKNGVTVHTVLTAVNVIALSQMMKNEGIKLPKAMQMAWPIDLRRFTDLKSPQTLRTINSSAFCDFRTKTDISQDEFAKYCKAIHGKIKELSTLQKCTRFMGMWGYLLEAADKGQSPLQVIEDIGLMAYGSLSNVGVQNVTFDDTEREVKVSLAEQFFMLSGVKKMGGVLFFHGIGTVNGQVMWNIVMNPNNVSMKFKDKYAETIMETFNKYCSLEVAPA